jgi:hypothetical protein
VIAIALTAMALAVEPAVEAAPSPEVTPAATPEVAPAASPVAASASEPPPELTAEDRRRLQDFRFKTLAVSTTGTTFRVHDGLGATLGVTSFAKTTNDSDTLAELARDRKHAQVHEKALVYSGVGLIAASAVTLLAGLPNKEPAAREDVAYTAVFLGLSGGLLWWISPMAEKAKESPSIDEYYTRTEAETRADSYNDALRTRLGIDAIQPAPPGSP